MNDRIHTCPQPRRAGAGPALSRLATLSSLASLSITLLMSACLATSGAGQAGGVPPGMNAQGEVTDPRKVEPGHGQKVRGIGGWDGEITGKPVPGSRFAQLKIGMSASEAQGLLGAPSDFGAQATVKNFIPYYMGNDKTRYQAVYKGQGRLLFSSSSASGTDQMFLVWIVHSAADDGRR